MGLKVAENETVPKNKKSIKKSNQHSMKKGTKKVLRVSSIGLKSTKKVTTEINKSTKWAKK